MPLSAPHMYPVAIQSKFAGFWALWTARPFPAYAFCKKARQFTAHRLGRSTERRVEHGLARAPGRSGVQKIKGLRSRPASLSSSIRFDGDAIPTPRCSQADLRPVGTSVVRQVVPFCPEPRKCAAPPRDPATVGLPPTPSEGRVRLACNAVKIFDTRFVTRPLGLARRGPRRL